MTELPVIFVHAAEVGSLPEHHREPLDRMLIAQARSERLELVLGNSAFDDFDVAVYW